MDKIIFDDFCAHYPTFCNRAIRYCGYGAYELEVELDDGSIVLYDYVNKTIRQSPKYEGELTEQECRNEFAMRLRRMLYSKNITREELEKSTGISQVMLSRYISGKVNPSFAKVYKICRAIGCSMDDLCYMPKKD